MLLRAGGAEEKARNGFGDAREIFPGNTARGMQLTVNVNGFLLENICTNCASSRFNRTDNQAAQKSVLDALHAEHAEAIANLQQNLNLAQENVSAQDIILRVINF